MGASCNKRKKETSSPQSPGERTALEIRYLSEDTGTSSLGPWTPGENSPPKSTGSKFQVQLNRTRGQPLGMEADPYAGGTLLVSAVHRGGLIQDWNKSFPALSVKVGDCILAVNEAKSNSAKLIEECQKKQHLDLTLMRGSEQPQRRMSDKAQRNFVFAAKIDKARQGGALGMRVDCRTNGHLVVAGVLPGGAVEEWNNINADTIRAGDRIVSVNGCDVGEKMIEMCQKDQLLDIVLMRGRTSGATSRSPLNCFNALEPNPKAGL